MKRFESKRVFMEKRKTRFNSLISSAGEWIAPMAVWVVVSAMGLAIICVLLAPVE